MDIYNLGRLPEPARSKYIRLRQSADDSAALAREASDRRNELRPDLQSLQTELDGLRRVNLYTGTPVASAERLEGVRTALLRLRREAERLDDLVEQRGSEHQRRRALVEHISRVFADVSASEIQMYEGAAPRLKRPETAGQAVERTRSEMQALDAERAQVAAAPIPSAAAKLKAKADVVRLIARGKPDVSGLVSGRSDAVGWVTLNAVSYPTPQGVFGLGEVEVPMLDGGALLAWLAPEALLERLYAEIDSASDDTNALTAEQRNERLADLDRRRLDLERQEEHWLDKAEHDGLVIERRSDASPLAVLGVTIADAELITAEQAEEAA